MYILKDRGWILSEKKGNVSLCSGEGCVGRGVKDGEYVLEKGSLLYDSSTGNVWRVTKRMDVKIDEGVCDTPTEVRENRLPEIVWRRGEVQGLDANKMERVEYPISLFHPVLEYYYTNIYAIEDDSVSRIVYIIPHLLSNDVYTQEELSVMVLNIFNFG